MTMRHSRRQFLVGAAGCALASGGWARLGFGQQRKGTRLILLGTKGGPRVGGTRKNPSTLLMINDVPYVVDCGYATSQQLVAAGVPLNKLRYLFFTHLHSDHMLEYGPVVYHGWVAGLRTRVDAYGPPPLKSLTRAFWEYVKFDVDTRIEDEGRPDPRPLLVANEFDAPGIVMQNDDVKVSSATVVHPPIRHAFGYRFDTRDRSIVISGDTNYAPGLIALAKGADVLVHEILYLPALDRLLARVTNAATLRKHIVDSHTVGEDVGRVAAEAQVKTLVLSHFVPGDDPHITDEMWTADVRKHFKGPIIVGKDLMEI
jgi:ribonuclease BN (tRNA processing enzyme)